MKKAIGTVAVIIVLAGLGYWAYCKKTKKCKCGCNKAAADSKPVTTTPATAIKTTTVEEVAVKDEQAMAMNGEMLMGLGYIQPIPIGQGPKNFGYHNMAGQSNELGKR